MRESKRGASIWLCPVHQSEAKYVNPFYHSTLPLIASFLCLVRLDTTHLAIASLKREWVRRCVKEVGSWLRKCCIECSRSDVTEGTRSVDACLCESVHVPKQLKERTSRSAIYSVNKDVSVFAVEARSLIHCC